MRMMMIQLLYDDAVKGILIPMQFSDFLFRKMKMVWNFYDQISN